MVAKNRLLSQQKNTGSLLDLINVREVKDDCLASRPTGTKNKQEREYRAVLRVDPVNFALMSDKEQEAILESFRVLLHRQVIGETLSIHIRVLPYDLTPYRDALAQARENATTELMQDMATEHEQFVLNLASRHAILQREFYIRVSAPLEPQNGLARRRKLTPEELYDRARSALDRRCADLIQDIERCGLTAHRLNDYELAQYYLSCIHTHYAEHYPMQPIQLQGVDLPPRALRMNHLEMPTSVLFPANDTENDDHHTLPGTTLVPLNEQEDTITTVLDLTPAETEPTRISPADQLAEGLKGATRKAKQYPPPRKRSWWPFGSGVQAGKQAKNPASQPTPYATLSELIAPALLEQRENYVRLHRETSELFRGRAIKGYPAFVVSGWLDRLIQIDEPYVDILLFLETLDPGTYTAALSRTITGYRATQSIEARNGRTENPYIAEARVQVEDLRQKLVQQVERVHSVTLLVASRGSTVAELKARDEKIISLLRSLDLEHVELSLEHLQGWQCMLPDSVNLLASHRKILDTSTLVTAFPFASTSLSTEPGSLYGIMPSGSLVIINPSSPQLDNGHEVKFAKSGAGKSYHEKVVLARRLLMGYHSIVVDPEDEYLALCRQFEGVNVRLSSGALQLNPFELPHSDNKERNVLEEKFQSLLVLFDLLLADRNPGMLTQREKSYINKALTRVYYEQGITSDPTTHSNPAPNMNGFHHILESGVVGRDEFDLADRLLRYLPAFPAETIPLATNNPLLVFNIRDLSDELRPAATYLIIDYAWTLVRSERRPRARQFILDEAWTLLQFGEAGRHLGELCRRARKYNLSLRITSQNVEDFLGSEAGRIILTNSSMKFLMKQDPASIDEVTRAFHLSDGERKFLLSCQRGEGLFFCGQSHVPLKVVASDLEHRIATTNPQELLQQEEQIAQMQEHDTAHRMRVVVESRKRDDTYATTMPHFYKTRLTEFDNDGQG